MHGFMIDKRNRIRFAQNRCKICRLNITINTNHICKLVIVVAFFLLAAINAIQYANYMQYMSYHLVKWNINDTQIIVQFIENYQTKQGNKHA